MTLHIKDKGAILKRKKRDSSDDDGASDSFETIRDDQSQHHRKPHRNALNRSKVLASIPLNQPDTSATHDGFRAKLTLVLSKCKDLWSQCCNKHFPPIARDMAAPTVEMSDSLLVREENVFKGKKRRVKVKV